MKTARRRQIKKELKMKRCKYCGATENLTIDHKVPIKQGGKDELKNLQCLCKRCNGTKSGLSHAQVRGLFRWFLQVQESRVAHGKKPMMFKLPKNH